MILRLRNMTAIDATGLHELEKLTDRLHGTGRTLLLCCSQYGLAWYRSGFKTYKASGNDCRGNLDKDHALICFMNFRSHLKPTAISVDLK